MIDPANRRAADTLACYPEHIVGFKTTAHYWTRDAWDAAHRCPRAPRPTMPCCRGSMHPEASRIAVARVSRGRGELECELTLRAGRVVWDPHGIGMPEWHDAPAAYWNLPALQL